MRKISFLLAVLLIPFYGCGNTVNEDAASPTIISTSPGNNATGLAVNSNVKVTFSETMDSSSINSSTFTVRKGGSNINGSISYGGTFATFLPISSLSTFRGYTATITTGVKDSNGNALASGYSWGFITGSSSTSTVSFATQIQPIFNSYCILCHVATGGSTTYGNASFLPLDSGTSYGNLVDVPATYSSGTRVVPGNSSGSVLYKRIGGTSDGAQMPKNGPPYLSSEDQDLIKTWVDEGALDN